MSFGFAPQGWALCNGQTLPINQNQALFAILGTQYGGDGIRTFALPNFQGRVPMHVGNGLTQGESAGEQAHTLLINEIPSHTHVPTGSSNDANQVSPAAGYWAISSCGNYSSAGNTTLGPQVLGNAGGGQPHDNLSPYLTLNFCIALAGIFPSRG